MLLFQIFLAGLHVFTVSVYDLGHFKDAVKASEAKQNPRTLHTRGVEITRTLQEAGWWEGARGEFLASLESGDFPAAQRPLVKCLMEPAWGLWRSEMGEEPGASLGAQWVFNAQGTHNKTRVFGNLGAGIECGIQNRPAAGGWEASGKV